MKKIIITIYIGLFMVNTNVIAAGKTKSYASVGISNLKYDENVTSRNSLLEARFGINITPISQ